MGTNDEPAKAPRDYEAELQASQAEIEGLRMNVAVLSNKVDEVEEAALARYAGFEMECSMLRHEVLRLRKEKRRLLGRPKKTD